VEARRKEKRMTSSLTELRPPPTLPAEPPARIRQQPSTIGYWAAAIVAVLGLTAALVWGAVGTVTALDRVDPSTAWRFQGR
jgi:hypothetical protein